MLFFDPNVSEYVNEHFEPTWQMVRPVPKITIDFGNSVSVTRTLHGNIATYICLSSGNVVDVLPGLYEPKTYLEELQQVHQFAAPLNMHADPDTDVKMVLYHLHAKHTAAVGVLTAPVHFLSRWIPALSMVPETNPTNLKASEIRKWKELYQDAVVNNSLARFKIHNLLIESNVTPDQITKHIYKEVLHVDLDDPYLGLGQALFKSYPFAK